MGWQEEQAAARAREQQRQNYQRAESARRAESIRRENETRSREQRHDMPGLIRISSGRSPIAPSRNRRLSP